MGSYHGSTAGASYSGQSFHGSDAGVGYNGQSLHGTHAGGPILFGAASPASAPGGQQQAGGQQHLQQASGQQYFGGQQQFGAGAIGDQYQGHRHEAPHRFPSGFHPHLASHPVSG